MEKIKYKLSQFNIVEKYNDDTFILFNSASGSLISLDSTDYNVDFLSCNDKNNTTRTLIDYGFWVDSRCDELFLQKARRQIRTFNSSPNKHIVIAPTMRCNARCYYCYEQGRETPTMTEDVINGVVNFLIDYCKTANSINLSWFGGEPLLGESIIDKIIKSLSSSIHIPITSTITTNASLLNDVLINKMINEWNLKKIQITLDGCNEYYNKVKNYVDGVDYYNNIMHNIQKLSDLGVFVSIRINVSFENVEETERLIDYINQRFVKNPYVNIYYMPLVKYSDRYDPRIIENAKDLEIICSQIYNKLKQYNPNYVNEYSFMDRSIACSAKTEDFFIIDPNGLLYKCQHDLGDEAQSVGDVFNGPIHNSIMSDWCFSDVPEKCLKCNYLPMCQGGCKISDYKCIITKYLIRDYIRDYYTRSVSE